MTATGTAQQRRATSCAISTAPPPASDDAGESLVDVEDTFESLTLSFEEGVEDGRRHVSQRGALGKGDHRQRQPVGSGEQFGRELVGRIEADGDPGHLRRVEAGDEPLPLLTGGDEHGCVSSPPAH